METTEELTEEKTELTIREKVDLGIELTIDELREFEKTMDPDLLKEPEPEPEPIPEKSQEQKWIDGDEPLPKEMKIINGKIEYKTPKELYSDKVWDKARYSEYQRDIRDNYLQQTDKYLLPDFPISSEDLDTITNYRQTLRDIPSNKNFPDVDIPKNPLGGK